MYISHSVMEGQRHNNPLNPRCFCLQRPKKDGLVPNARYRTRESKPKTRLYSGGSESSRRLIEISYANAKTVSVMSSIKLCQLLQNLLIWHLLCLNNLSQNNAVLSTSPKTPSRHYLVLVIVTKHGIQYWNHSAGKHYLGGIETNYIILRQIYSRWQSNFITTD